MSINDILERALDRLPSLKRIIVEVNHDEDKMRRWISDHHYTIEEEAVVYDRGFCYSITAFSAKPHPSYSEEEILCGVSAEMKKTPAYREYAERQIRQYEQITVRAKDPSVIENARCLKTIWEKQIENAE
jgi:tRNA (adenine22-N1)-methyltransferase